MKKYMVVSRNAQGKHEAYFYDDFFIAVTSRLALESQGRYAELYGRYTDKTGYELIG